MKDNSNTYTTTLSELATRFDDLLRIPPMGQKSHENGTVAKGFSIGKGKLLYWYITPYSNSGTYRCIQEGYESKRVSIRWGVSPNQLVTIHY